MANKLKAPTQTNDSYNNVGKINFASFNVAGGSKTSGGAISDGSENNDAIKSSLASAESGGGTSGYNKDLNSRIDDADNIAQETRLKIKLDKKEGRQEKRAQNKLDRNPEYKQKVSDIAEGRIDASIGKLDAAMNSYKPVNVTKGNGMPTTDLLNEGGGVFGLSSSVTNGSTPSRNTLSKVSSKGAVTGSIKQTTQTPKQITQTPKQSNLISKGVAGSIQSAFIPELKSSIPSQNTTGSTLDVARRGKQGTSNTSSGGLGKTPGSGKFVGKIGPLSDNPNAHSSQSVFGTSKRNKGFGGGNPLSGKRHIKPPKMKKDIHKKTSWGIKKPNTQKYL